MFKRFIKNIRRQPKEVRNKIALVIAGVFTAFIFTVWMYHLPDRMLAITESHDEDSSPIFSQLFGEIGDTLSSVKEAVSQEVTEGEAVNSEPEITPEQLEITASTTSPAMPTPAVSSSTSSLNNASDSTVRAIRIMAASSSTATTSAEIR